jgi:quercetin dioxygenase-like cupin family protein
MIVHDWSRIEKEQMNPHLARQVIHTENMTVARIYLAKGVVVPEHSHVNEQVTSVLEGKLKFHCGGKERVVTPGQTIQTEPNAPHWVEALEDSVALDLFAPRREDWIRGDDAYLRK